MLNLHMLFTIYLLAGFIGMEVISYLVHRYLFHGILWNIHKSHHTPRHGLFELNDLFSLFFAGVSIALIWTGSSHPLQSPMFALGVGTALYGVLYFIIHDLFAHRRFFPFTSDNALMRLIRRAHQRHHQTAEKEGREPYGLFLFPYDKYRKGKSR